MDYVFENYCKLDELCEIQGTRVSVEECVECCGGSYYGGDSEYQCANFKKVYLIKYLAVQVAQIESLIEKYILHDIENKVNLSVVSLGGGPGTEIIALMNELNICAGNYNVSFDNVDREASWKPIYEDLASRFAKQMKNVKLKTSFITCDAASYNSDKRYDIVFVSWILSQVDERDRRKILKIAGGLTAEEGHIIVTDRLEPLLITNLSTLIKEIEGLTILEHDKLTDHCGVTFPEEIKETFEVRILLRTAFWVLQRSSNEFFN